MNSLLSELEKNLLSLKSSNSLLAIKAEFEAEGTRIDELSILSYLCTKNEIPLTLKIGGASAKRDFYEAFQLGADNILVPMIESDYALENCCQSFNDFAKDFKSLNKIPSLSINIESITGCKNFRNIIDKIKILSLPIRNIVIGRSDLAESLGLKDVNSEIILNESSKIIELCNKNNIEVTIGGNLTKDSYVFLKNYTENQIKAFESRKCTFLYLNIIDKSEFSEIIEMGLKFELSWLNFKRKMYLSRSEEENLRISTINKRISK